MDKTLYNTAMDKVTMSDECIGSILDSIEEVQTEKKPKKIRYIHIIAALAVFLFGSVGVAAETLGFDWINKFFSMDEVREIVVDQTVTDLITELEDFTCESDYGIKFSPIGCISDYRNLYVLLNIDELPDDIDLKNDGYFFALDFSDKQGGFSCGTNFVIFEQNTVSIGMECSEDFFKNDETIKLDVKQYDEVPQTGTICAAMSFKINNNENYPILRVDYSNYKPDENYDDTFFDEITVTPLSISTHGHKDVWGMNQSSYDGKGEFRFIFNDGTEIKYRLSGGGGNPSLKEYTFESVFMEGPINPDNITEIYFDDMLVYRK